MSEHLFRPEEERTAELTQREQEYILRADPSFRAISGAIYFDNYDLPCPIRVSVALRDGKTGTAVLRKTRHGSVRTEIRVLRALKECGLPVPDVLAGPFENEKGECAAVYSLLPGENLQKLSTRSGKGLASAKSLLVQAVIMLNGATDRIQNHAVSEIVPKLTLAAELETASAKNNAWAEEKAFQAATRKLKNIFEGITTPLVFSNGDYQPGNFLAQGGEISGFLDFESPSFQDPLMGFVKYSIYDLLPLSKTNLIETFLHKKGFSEKDFNCRLALGCLKALRKEIPVSGGGEEIQKYRNRVLALLDRSLRNQKPET